MYRNCMTYPYFYLNLLIFKQQHCGNMCNREKTVEMYMYRHKSKY